MFYLQLEWKKLKTSRLFQVLVLLYVVLFPLLYFSARNLHLPELFEGGVHSFYMFPKIWGALGYMGSWLTFFFLGFLSVNMLGQEFADRTLRQNIITGLSRAQFFWSKIAMMGVISAVAAVYYGIVGLVFGFIYTDYVVIAKVLEGIDLIPRFFLQSFGFMAFAFMLTMLLRRSGILPLFIYVTYSLVVEMILRYGFHRNVIGEVNSMNYYPLNALEDLVPQPIPPAILDGMNLKYDFFLSPALAAGLSIGYIGLFLWVAYWDLHKRDL